MEASAIPKFAEIRTSGMPQASGESFQLFTAVANPASESKSLLR
jgi:hypothetical protein